MTSLFSIAGVALALAAPVLAQNWATNNQSPSVPTTPRTSFGMAYNILTGRTVLYGGRTSSLGDRETWTFDGTTWILQTPTTSPPALWGHVLVSAPNLGGILLYGGRVGTVAQNQTWLWNGMDWRQIMTATTPPARAFFQMAFDTRRGVAVMHGGFALIPVAASRHTWEFDGTDWRSVATSTLPLATGDGRMVYDSSRGVCVMFGGWDGSARAYNGLWEYDGVDWRSVSLTPEPSGRQWHMMSYDMARSRVILQGGFGGGASNGTWEYCGERWTLQSVGQAPTDGPDGQMVYDAIRGVHVYYGGRGPAGFNTDTWEFTGVDRAASYAFAGSGCSPAGTVPTLAAAPGSAPRAGQNFAVEVTNLSATAGAAFVFFGFSNASSGLPIDLAIVGLPGCLLQCDTPVAAPMQTVGNTASFSIALPAAALGQSYWNQGFVFDPSAGNPTGAFVTNAMRAYVGQ